MNESYYSLFLKRHIQRHRNGGPAMFGQTVRKAMALDVMLKIGGRYSKQAAILKKQLDEIAPTKEEIKEVDIAPVVSNDMFFDEEGKFYTEYDAKAAKVKLFKIGEDISISFDGIKFDSVEELAKYLMKLNYSKAKNIKTVISYIERNSGKDKIYGKEFKYKSNQS